MPSMLDPEHNAHSRLRGRILGRGVDVQGDACMSSRFALRVARCHSTGLAACAAFCVAGLMPASSLAQDSWGGSLTVTSDYRLRGLSKTRGDAAIQGGLHTQPLPGWILGTWASTISRDRGGDSAIEVDVHTGYAWTVAKDWDAKVLLTHYLYPDDPAPVDYDYDELSASIAFRSQFAATVTWSPNTKYFARYQGSWHAEEGAVVAYEMTGLQPITPSLAIMAGVGYNDLRRIYETGYWYWNAGVSYAVGPIQLDVSHIDSDSTAEQLFGPTVTEAGWSAAISWRF
jgi:uncharacterized protein (TIGR02001 family)